MELIWFDTTRLQSFAAVYLWDQHGSSRKKRWLIACSTHSKVILLSQFSTSYNLWLSKSRTNQYFRTFLWN